MKSCFGDNLNISSEKCILSGIAEGFTIPFSDIIIATIAFEYNFQIFTLDKHFDSIPNIKVYPLIPNSK
jgi:predicted nucleic acid-binding protein